MNRIDRLAAIVIQLQSRRLVKAKDIADKFSLSLRTVYRDIKALDEAGVPIIGEAGTGYRLMEGYKLPPLMFTEDEAAALLTGSKLVRAMCDERSLQHYTSALDKIKAVLRLSQKAHLEDLDEHIAVVRHPAAASKNVPDLHLATLLKAISTSTVLHMQYRSIEKKESLNRTVEPIGIYHQGSSWYLIAFCRLRAAYRNFRTDKIEAVSIGEEKLTLQHPPLSTFLCKLTERERVHQVVIDVDRDIVRYFGEQKYYNGFVSEEELGDQVRMTFLAGSLHQFARWFLFFGERATVLTPLSLKDLVASMASNILARLERDAAATSFAVSEGLPLTS